MITAIAAGVTLPLYGDKIPFFQDDAAAAPDSTETPPIDAAPTLDQQTLDNMLGTVPREQKFTMEINGVTYAWPVGRPDFNLYDIALPCDLDATSMEAVNAGKKPCHHWPSDPGYTPYDNLAIDFTYADVDLDNDGSTDRIQGEPVNAFTNGTIIDIRTNGTCASLYLQSDREKGGDGHTYWYEKIAGSSLVTEGQDVTAGQDIGQVGGLECAEGGSVPHIHFQSMPEGVTDASKQNRDGHAIEIAEILFTELYRQSTQGQ